MFNEDNYQEELTGSGQVEMTSEEYNETCISGYAKILDLAETEPRIDADERETLSSTDSIPYDDSFGVDDLRDKIEDEAIDEANSMLYDNDDFDFEGEDKPVVQSPLLKSYEKVESSEAKPLVDGEPHSATIDSIEASRSTVGWMEFLIITFLINDTLKPRYAEDKYIFTSNSAEISIKRLKKNLKQCELELTKEDFTDVYSIKRACESLIGKSVIIEQSSREGSNGVTYTNYSVIKTDEKGNI